MELYHHFTLQTINIIFIKNYYNVVDMDYNESLDMVNIIIIMVIEFIQDIADLDKLFNVTVNKKFNVVADKMNFNLESFQGKSKEYYFEEFGDNKVRDMGIKFKDDFDFNVNNDIIILRLSKQVKSIEDIITMGLNYNYFKLDHNFAWLVLKF